MSTITVDNPYPFFTDTNGKALEDGNIYIGVAGSDAKTNPITAYWDDALTVIAAQPIQTIEGYPDNGGSPSSIFTGSDFSITIEDKTDVLIYSKLQMNANELALFNLLDVTINEVYLSVALLLASTEASRGAGETWVVDGPEGRFSYEEAVGGYLTNAAGVKFNVTPDDGAYAFNAFDSDAQTFMPLIGDDTQMQPRHIDGGSDDLFVLLGETPVTSGINLPNFSARNNTGAGISLGSRAASAAAYTEQQGRTGIVVDGSDIFKAGDVNASTYGISVVGVGARVTNFNISDVNIPTDGADDSEGLYTKLQDSFVWGGIIEDSGREAAWSIKGKESGDTTGPAGFGNLFGGVQFFCSAAFAAADGGSAKKGLKIECGGNVITTMRFKGWTGSAWYTGTGEVGNFKIDDIDIFASGASGSGAARLLCEGGVYRIGNNYVKSPNGSAFEVKGQTLSTEVIYTSPVIQGATGSAFLIDPTDDNVLEVEILGGTTTTTGNDFITLVSGSGRVARLLVDGHRIADIGGSFINANVIPMQLIWRNSPVDLTTTDATTTTAITLPVPTDGSASMTVKVTGVSGPDVFYQSFETAFSNTAGVATKEGENAGTAIASAGAATWAAVVNVTGGNARVRVTGAAATNIEWTVDVDYHGNT